MHFLKTTAVFKVAAALLLALLTLATLTGCGGNNGGSDKVTVTLMTWENTATNGFIDQAMAQFMKANPTITVQRIPSPNSNYGDKLSSLVLAHKLPDLFWCGNDTEQQLGSEGLLYDWSSLAGSTNTSSFSLNNFAPASIDNWKVGGKLYGLPSLMNTYGIWYNADAFTAAGLALPKPGWSWDEMYHDAQVLSKKSGNTTQYGLVDSVLTVASTGPFYISNYSVSAGGQPFEDKINNPTKVTVDDKFTEGVGKLAAAVQAGAVNPPGYDTSNASDSFAAGKIPMLLNGQWLGAGYIQSKPSFKYGFAPLPTVNSQVQPYDAVGICTPANTKHPDAVWKALQYLDTTAWQTVLVGAPVAPSAYVPAAQPYFNTLKQNGLDSAATAVNYELTTPTKEGIRFTSTWSAKANDVLTAHWDDILMGKKPLSDLQTMAQQVNSIIASNS